MTPGLDVAPKRTRESTSRARTGCSTCKTRRVKCDEEKPICRRCTVGGRNCEYNTACAVTAPRRNVFTVYLPPLQNQPMFFVNDCGVDFFHHNLAAKLDGQFESKFWSKLVLQLSHSEPSIRHAVSAISVVYQDVESSLRHPAGYVNANPDAQQDWNTAMRILSARIQTQPNSKMVPLVCCLLFTCIDFLRGNLDSSMLHAENGIKILAELRRNSDSTKDLRSGFSSNDFRAIEDHIVPMFSRLNVVCSLAGRITPPIRTSTAEKNSPQEDLADSRRRLVEILDTCIRFIHEASLKAAIFEIDVDDLIEQVKLQTKLDTWFDQLEKLLERMQASGNPPKQDALCLLLVHYKVMYIWMRVCTTAEETATDIYHADFEELVHYAEQVAKSGVGTVNPEPLSFDIQIVGPLYYVAMKCRHPAIRRRAVELLQLAPRREGLWNAHHAFVTAKRVIEIEERHFTGQGLPGESSRLHGLPLPDDEHRVYNLGEMPFDFRKFNHSIVPSPTYPGTLEAVFQTKPWGILGEWQAITEYITL